MTKFRKAAIATILGASTLCIGAFALSACGSKDYTVTFDIEGKTQTAEVVDGKVGTMPANPEKDYYTFMGWYTTSDFKEGTEFTKDTEVTANTTVYAYFAPIKVNITVNGGTAENIKLEELTTKETSYTATAESQNLTFDGWYVDSNYTTKYTAQSADNLYARYMATVTFNNGYEDLQTQLIAPSGTVTAPDLTSSDFVKSYMDKEDISYQNAEGETIEDISAYTVTSNEVITVLWKTPNMEYEKISDGVYQVTRITKSDTAAEAQYPVFSVFSKNVTVDDKGTKGTVVAVNDGLTCSFKNNVNAVQYIFNEGIKYISGLRPYIENSVQKVTLPSTLKVLENSFWNLSGVEVNLPEGLEVIINCFWDNVQPSLNSNEDYNFQGGYSFHGYQFNESTHGA